MKKDNCMAFEGLLYDFADDLLEGQQLEDMKTHCDHCEYCSAIVAEIQAVTSCAVSIPEVDVPEDRIWQALETRIKSEGVHAVSQREAYLPHYLLVLIQKFKRIKVFAVPALVTALVLFGVFPIWYPTNTGQLPSDPELAASKILDSGALVQESVGQFITDASSEARWDMLEEAFGDVTLDDMTSDVYSGWESN